MSRRNGPGGWRACAIPPSGARCRCCTHIPRGDWTTEDLADQVHLSRSAFADRFTSLLGQPPMRYLTVWRMQLAAQRLREGRLSIAQIAYDCGYESEATFTRAFKREFGAPPSAWRRNASGEAPRAPPS
jgi:AraC-like DNA-binding protein